MVTALSTKAQIGGGYNSAFNFGGRGSGVKDMRYDASGNLFFIATIFGKNLFAGTQVDAGGTPPPYASYPYSGTVYGKIAPNGTQTLLKHFNNAGEGRLDADGNLMMILSVGFPTAPVDFGNGIINDTNGAKIIKISNTGVAQWIKPVTTGTDILSGTTGKPSLTILGLQFTPDGNLFAVLAPNNASPNPPTPQFTIPNRIIKFDANGDEVWHTEVFSAGLSNLSVPRTFVDDAGRVTFGINATNNQFYFNGEPIASQMGVYSFGQSQHSIVISLNADGSKKSTIADKGTNAVTTFSGLNPINGNLYISYGVFANNKSTQAPFSNFPFVQTTGPFSGGGTLIFNSSGQFLAYKDGRDFQPSLASTFRNGNNFISLKLQPANNIYERGDYVFNDILEYSVVEFLDQDLNFVKALKSPKLSIGALYQDKVSLSGEFINTVTFGSTTLTANFNDTDFNTRFPYSSYITQDMFIAVADGAVVAPPVSSNWLGVDNNWNNTANWSGGKVPDVNTIVRFNSTKPNMPTTATTPTALRVIIDAGVFAQLPVNLIISNKLIINGTLQINHTGALSFTNYSAVYASENIEGTGTLAFNGTGTPSVMANFLKGYKDLSLETNENITLSSGTFKNITFTGTNAVIASQLGVEITNPDVNAISGQSPTNHIQGKLTRAVNANGVYVFPNKQNSYAPYEPTTLTLNNLVGTTKITVENDYGALNPNLSFATGTCTKQLGDYYWRITPNVAPTGGSYDVSFQKSVFSNGVTDPDRYVVLKRDRITSQTLWTFEGTKTASTQTGGTISGTAPNEKVTNATVTAGLTGLTKFSEFTIGINSTPVATNTAVVSSTWSGATNTEWNNAGNWSAGIPNASVNALIPSGLTNYPAIYTATDNAKSLTIASGVSNMKLSHVLTLTNGLVNNTSLEIAGLLGYGGLFSGYGGDISGSGKLIFKKSGLITSIKGGVVNNDIDVDLGNTVYDYISLLGKIGGNINVISGAVNAAENGGINLELTNPNSTITIAAPSNHIAGRLLKSVNTTGSYVFPIGDEQFSRNGIRKYGEIAIVNNAIEAPTVYSVKFDSYYTTPVALTIGSDLYNSFINSGQWFVAPTNFSTTGTIDLTLKTSNYTNGRASTSDYVLLRKGASNWVIVNGATITETSGTITVTATGLAPFSTNTMFCVGLKATTTTWTGAAGTANWNTAGNWSNGVPTELVKAIIANVSLGRVYPNNPPAGAFSIAAIEIAAGSTITLPSTFYPTNGIINNGTINIDGSGFFYGFGSGNSYCALTGTGKLVLGTGITTFDSYFMGNTLNNSLELNNPAGLTINRTTTFTGNVTLTNGIVTMGAGQTFIMSNPNATAIGSSTAYINGDLKRTVNASGLYNFPIGNSNGYAPASLNTNTLVGVTDITAKYSAELIDGQPNLTIGNSSVKSILAGGTWFITPNTQPTSGNYSINLSALLGSSLANEFFVLKRAYNYSFANWENLGVNVASSILNGSVIASVTGLAGFSQFGIGEGITTLPVKMVKFLASADAKSAKLYWETASERNNDKFEVEHSTNGKDFAKVGEVKGNGTSQKLNTYSFKDFAPANGVNYYRLKQLDFSGDFEYSDVKFVNFELEAPIFSIYPNPATDVINFSQVVKSVEIYNVQGILLLQQNGTVSSVKIPTSFATGLYLTKMILTDNSSVTKQILINK